jgi:hypothetical protein
MAAVGFQQDVGHAEAHGAERDDDQQAHRRPPAHEKPPGVDEVVMGLGLHPCGAHPVARLLLPHRDQVQRHRHHRGALHHLHQLAGGVVLSSPPKISAAAIMPTSSITYISPTTLGCSSTGTRSVASARPTVCTICTPAPTSRKASAALECRSRAAHRPPDRITRQHQQREGHDREAAELQHRALPDVGNAAPAERGFVDVGAVADQRAERREEKRQRNHHAHQRRGHLQLDDHHAVERAHQQHQRHADRDLEQRQAQQARQRQILGRHIREGHVARSDLADLAKREVTGAEHGRGEALLLSSARGPVSDVGARGSFGVRLLGFVRGR